MVLVLPGRQQQQPTTAQRFIDAFGAGLESVSSHINQKQQQKLAEEQMSAENQAAQAMGVNLAGIKDPKMRQQILASALQGKRDESQGQSDLARQIQLQQAKFEHEKQLEAMRLEGKANKENQILNDKEAKRNQELNEKIAPLKSAIGRVQEMKKIRAKGNLGRGSSIVGFFGGETAKDRGAYQTLGNSLIAYASTIPVRNRAEFETLTGKINDPDITDAEAEGVLNEMERIISDSLNEYQGIESKSSKSQESGKKIPLGDIWK